MGNHRGQKVDLSALTEHEMLAVVEEVALQLISTGYHQGEVNRIFTGLVARADDVHLKAQFRAWDIEQGNDK